MVSECERLSQAIEAKKEDLLTKIKQQAEAKLKTLTLHRAHFEMLASCASQLIAQCDSLSQSHPSSTVSQCVFAFVFAFAFCFETP